ncbi:MAG: glycosyltransferase family 4 protein, partial [Actinomycetota bacterium]|nr:glycosyltransferase family 4 protein [Actinomycetota bacterium]
MLYDLQGAQSTDHRDRGIARYVTELALALDRRSPSAVDAFLLNPDLPLPGGIEPLVASGKLRFVDDPNVYERGSVLHLASPIELAIPIDRLLPPAARAAQVRVVCTVFDLIPFTMPATYLEDPGLRRRYLARIEVVRSADRVLAISDFVAREVTTQLGVPRSRVVSTPLVPSAGFRPPPSAASAGATARAAIPRLAERFVLYTGGSDGRKNLEGLLEGWARLPERLRSQWQLVVAGSLPPLRRNHLEVMAARLGFADTFLTTGFLPEETLIACTQAAQLFVFPSLAEGFGLPVAEALACGTPAIGSDATSIVELLPDDARFDPTSPDAIAAAIARALTDDDHRSRLVAWAARQPRRTWDDVATETVAAYPPPARQTTAPSPEPMRVAFVSPLPPQPGGVAAYSAKLLTSLRSRNDVEIDVYVDGPPHQRPAMSESEGRPVAALERVEALTGRYDQVVYSLGNSEFHTGALHLLGRRPGVVLAHDVRLTNLYRFARWQHPEAVPGGFAETLHGMYDGRLPAELGEAGELSADEAERWGLLMVRDIVRASTRFLTMSSFAAELARLDTRPEHRDRIGTVAFGIGPLVEPDAESTPLVVSFGVLN